VWLGLCFLSIASSLTALGVVARVAFEGSWVSFLGWLRETGLLGGGLALAWAGDWVAARQFLHRAPPRSTALDPRKTPAALLMEVVVLLTQPLAPIGVLALWIGEWVTGMHFVEHSQVMAFTLGRLIQSAVVLGFVIKWVGLMTTIQGRIASSVVRQR
jgi:hypothetical protein